MASNSLLTPRDVRAGNNLLARPITLLVSVAFLVIIALAWTALWLTKCRAPSVFRYVIDREILRPRLPGTKRRAIVF